MRGFWGVPSGVSVRGISIFVGKLMDTIAPFFPVCFACGVLGRTVGSDRCTIHNVD